MSDIDTIRRLLPKAWGRPRKTEPKDFTRCCTASFVNHPNNLAPSISGLVASVGEGIVLGYSIALTSRDVTPRKQPDHSIPIATISVWVGS